ncbi:uncharacterized protein LOC117737478 isoform X2 [Cyclopterus lumpus]|uniref:uncharacterized protein LOC117737478 isoform X2 n=1 Tax=Cyclopterus lumpus TaxID=8103 RepID=UPI001486D37B|nr:uncharacterized protein LOC117737478 isoform X2 [Cyclopterus lumpus]
MFMRGVFLNILLGNLLIAGAGSSCVPIQCLRCNTTGETRADPCVLCSNNSTECHDIPSNCTKDFQVSVNSTGSNIKEGGDITLTCLHNYPDLNLTFGWKRNKDILDGANKSKLFLKKVLSDKGGQYMCLVNSLCGSSESLPLNVTVENQSLLILVICGVSALVLVLIMGLAMKYKLKRDSAKHRERRLQKEMEQVQFPSHQ